MRVKQTVSTEYVLTEAELRRVLGVPKDANFETIGGRPWDDVLDQDGDAFILKVETEQVRRRKRRAG